ncbi:MAG: hypothetical protein P8Y39_05305 [Nitrospirota bacterium]
MSEALRRELLGAGAAQVGFASLRGVLSPELSHLRNAVCVGVDSRLREETLSLLLALQKRAARFLRKERHRFFPIPPDSDRVRDRFASRLYPLMTHKMAATCAGPSPERSGPGRSLSRSFCLRSAARRTRRERGPSPDGPTAASASPYAPTAGTAESRKGLRSPPGDFGP